MPTERFVKRTTMWQDVRGETVQLSIALLDPDSWEPLAVVTEAVGPFDDVSKIAAGATICARDLARGQVPGQLELTI